MLGLSLGENPKMTRCYIDDVLICGFCMKPLYHAEQQQNFKPQALPVLLDLTLLDSRIQLLCPALSMLQVNLIGYYYTDHVDL